MSNASAYIESMIADATDIINDAEKEDVQSRIDDFMAEFSGFKFQLGITGNSELTSKRNREGMLAARGWLISQMSNLTSQPGSSVSMNNQNSSNAAASATVDIDQVVNEVQSSELSAEDKERLELLLSGIERSAKAKDEGKTAERVKEALDIAGKTAGLVPTVLRAAGSIAGLF